MEKLKEYRNEIVKQLDIKAILQRLIFLEHSITYMLEDFQLEGIQLKMPETPSEIRRLRKRCNCI
jgi:phosphoribosylanthranilate isomerase